MTQPTTKSRIVGRMNIVITEDNLIGLRVPDPNAFWAEHGETIEKSVRAFICDEVEFHLNEEAV